MKRFVYLTFLALSMYCCSPKMGSTIYSPQPPLSETDFVLVLQKPDDFYNDGIEVGTIKSGDNGFSTNCSYYDIIENLKKIARKNGANLIKITDYRGPDHWSSCDRIKAKIYKVPDFRKHEKEFEWHVNRKLQWEDFKGKPKSDPTIAAAIYCNFSAQTIKASAFHKTKIYVKNAMTTNLSWVKPDKKRDEVLEHVQARFDLYEVYTRQLRKRLQEEKLKGFNPDNDVNVLFRDVYALLVEREQLYETETNHGIDRQKQAEWTRTISNELNALSNYTR